MKIAAAPLAALPKNKAAVCSPSGQENYNKDGTCFTKDALIRIANAWNKEHPSNKITGLKTKSKHAIWKDIDIRMSNLCNGSGKEWCWVGKLDGVQRDNKVQDNIRPKMPVQWYKKPNAWLSNWDIQKVMRQYDASHSRFNYRFLGVFPMDFEAKTSFGTCVASEICGLSADIPKLLKKKIAYIGMITNLDHHDEPGSHWTSLFLCIDHTKPCFGAYYYDSVSRDPPKEILAFVKRIKLAIKAHLISQGAIKADDPFKFRASYNKVRHQYGNTECGVFSMIFQIRWLELLEHAPNTTFEDVVGIKLTDEQMNKYYRPLLFSPNPQQA